MTPRILRLLAVFAACCLPVLMAGCSASKQSADRATPATVSPASGPLVNLAALNSSSDDFAAALAADCGALLFTSNRPRGAAGEMIDKESRYGERLYSSSGSGMQWSTPSLHPDNNLSTPNAGTAAFAGPGSSVLYAASYRTGGAGGTDLWGLPGMPGAVNSGWWESHPALSASGTLLVFSSDRRLEQPNTSVTGRQQTDLYLSRRAADGSWSRPERLPAPVSSDANDITPHVGADGYLYFASDRPGSSGYDIYRCSIAADGTTGPVERLAEPVNSTADDLFPQPGCDGCTMVLTSNRSGGLGGYDIWAVSQSRTLPARGSVTLATADGSLQPAANARIDLVPASGGGTVTVRSDAQGHYETELSACTAYTARAEERDCYTAPDPISIAPLQTVSHGAAVAVAPAELPEIVYRSAAGPAIDTWSDRIPCFVTGYWKPITTERYRELRARVDRKELAAASFINPDDYAYGDHLADIDGRFEQICRKIESTVALLDNGCMQRSTPLTITVVGYVDTMGLTRGRYPDETVRTTDADIPGRRLKGITVKQNEILWGQDGNTKLSHLRAYYTYREIDRVMRERSPRYAALKNEGRIVWKYCGGELPQSAGEYKADPDSRRFDIFIR